jgi:hypothetical protein
MAFAPEEEMTPGSNIESPSPPRFSAGEKVPEADEGAELAQTAQSGAAPHPRFASLDRFDSNVSLEAGDKP